MLYETSLCPHCSHPFQVMEPTGINTINLGTPLIECPRCHKPVKTNANYWRRMSKTKRASAKISVVLSTIYQAILNGFMGLFLTVLLAGGLYYGTTDIGDDGLPDWLVYLGGIAFLATACWRLTKIPENLRILREWKPDPKHESWLEEHGYPPLEQTENETRGS